MKTDKSSFVSAILLAAGESKRMGKPKLLLPFGDSTILEKTVDNILNSNADEVIVVLGANAQEMSGDDTNARIRNAQWTTDKRKD